MVKNMLPNRRQALRGGLFVSLGYVLGGWSAPSHAQEAIDAREETEAADVVVDWRTGLALYGIDPVAYFSQRQAVPGLPGFELDLSGVIWRFRNTGNRAAFALNPTVYFPQFAGYDPIAAGRGVATPGNPLVWLIHGTRLYLFYGPEARTAFAADPDAALAAAQGRWPELRSQLDATGAITALSQ